MHCICQIIFVYPGHIKHFFNNDYSLYIKRVLVIGKIEAGKYRMQVILKLDICQILSE